MADKREVEVKRLQENLEMLRKLFGWSAQDLGKKLGMGRQSILNLEHEDVFMSRVQYIAIRAVFESELSKRSIEEQENIRAIMMIVFDDDLEVPEEKKEQALTVARAVSNSSTKKDERAGAIMTLAFALGAIGISALVYKLTKDPAHESGFNSWLDKIIDKD